MKMTPQQIKDGLRNFYGTEGYIRYTFGILLTDGVKWLCDAAQSYWLVDAIGSWQLDKKVRDDEMLQGFQFWKLRVKTDAAGNKSAVLTLERDENNVALTQNIEYTDFPLDEIDLYYSPQDKVLLLPSEY
jgi:hypothetical protein